MAGVITESSKSSFFVGTRKTYAVRWHIFTLLHMLTVVYSWGDRRPLHTVFDTVDRHSLYYCFRLNAAYAGFRLLNGGQKSIFCL